MGLYPFFMYKKNSLGFFSTLNLGTFLSKCRGPENAKVNKKKFLHILPLIIHIWGFWIDMLMGCVSDISRKSYHIPRHTFTEVLQSVKLCNY